MYKSLINWLSKNKNKIYSFSEFSILCPLEIQMRITNLDLPDNDLDFIYKTFKDFYPYYLSEHDKKYTKLTHFIGTSIGIFFLIQFFLSFNFLFILYALLSGYGFAWVGHFFIEKNKPATFKYPFYSFIGDYKMYFEILQGKHKIF